ncbi:hypothetical protein KQX54_016473 [Cotesia glomerata]|uniref:Uncharacterized protein n=1 Tax=Cotesia glomerata TaxID=32391 RepID=A0AAV7J889_COTGL|nr:hypothetical protein KQX54_016473 [Cotesia glomerata]
MPTVKRRNIGRRTHNNNRNHKYRVNNEPEEHRQQRLEANQIRITESRSMMTQEQRKQSISTRSISSYTRNNLERRQNRQPKRIVQYERLAFRYDPTINYAADIAVDFGMMNTAHKLCLYLQIQGQIHHRTGALLPPANADHKFLQIYFLDYVSETEETMEISCTTATKFFIRNGPFKESIGTCSQVFNNKLYAFGSIRQLSLRQSLENTLLSFPEVKPLMEKSKRLQKQKEMKELWAAKTIFEHFAQFIFVKIKLENGSDRTRTNISSESSLPVIHLYNAIALHRTFFRVNPMSPICFLIREKDDIDLTNLYMGVGGNLQPMEKREEENELYDE